MDGGKTKHWSTLFALVLGAVAIGLAAHRADSASFTHDECYSYLHYPHLSFGEILRHSQAYTNNHLLNTLGMKYAELLFGPSELSLRLPNLLALAVYLFYGWQLLRTLSPMLAIGGFVLLCTNSYLMELFTLARGYGLSTGFCLMALFHLVQTARSGRTRDVVLFHVAATLASLSNFTLLTVHMAAVLVFFGAIYLFPGTSMVLRPVRKRLQLVNSGMMLVAVLILWEPVRMVRSHNTFDFGGKSGFYADTVNTWAQSATPGLWLDPSMQLVVRVMLSLVVLVPLAITLAHSIRRDSTFFTQHLALVVVVLVFVLVCIGVELQHALLDVDRLSSRFAMFLYPLIILLIPYQLGLLRGRAGEWTAGALTTCAVLWAVPTFLKSFSTYVSVEWGYDVRTEDAIATMTAHRAARGGSNGPALIGNHWVLEPSLNYYRVTKGLRWMERADRDGTKANDEYRLIFDRDEPASIAEGYARVAAWAESGTVLMWRPPVWP